ncbi:Hypothetical predicted protein [Lecanosticta acicola]|uniref:Uncharacterized protein n=1 Tax=Lecanosticta acicola TaxID=111012 RepID=A0AAI8YSN0_9PEZI|nr:Hypothetical predicted protein [Lecanosticta acicola]
MERNTSMLFLLTTIWLSLCRAQSLLQGSNGSAVPIWALADRIQGGSSNICNKTFADANATGMFNINPNVAQGPQSGQPDNHSGKTQDALVAVTIDNSGFSNTSNSSSSYSLWYNTNGANYSSDFALGYDVCVVAGLILNYNTQLRGQNDDGTCSSALDTPCINALNSRAEQYATWLSTPSPGPNSNLTNTSLPSLCRTLATQVASNIPDECSYFIQRDSIGIGWPLTSYGSAYETALFPSCTLNGTWQNTVGFFANASQAVYTAWVQSVTPVIGIWMPVIGNGANVGSTISIGSVVSQLLCGHVNTIKRDSFTPAAAPSPTAVKYNSTSNANNGAAAGSSSSQGDGGLSGGAIAGVVVGVVLGVLLLAGLILGLLWRKRNQQKKSKGPEQEFAEVDGTDKRFELTPEGGIKQLPANEREGGKPGAPMGELAGANPPELEGEKAQVRGELEGDHRQPPVELPGSSPDEKR